MKRLIYLPIFMLLFWQCGQDETTEITPENEANKVLQAPGPNSPLLTNSSFSNAYQNAKQQLVNARSELASQVDVRRLRTKGGMLVFPTVDSFRSIYEKVESVDSVWLETYDAQIEALLRTALRSKEILSQFKDEEDLENEIEDLLEADRINDFDVQQDIANRMPISTLWNRVKAIDDQWLAANEDEVDIDLSSNPTNQMITDDYMSIFLNDRSSINLLDTARNFAESVSKGNTKGRGLERTATIGQGCRTFRKSFNDGNNGSRKLKVVAKVRNWVVVKKLQTRIVGWKRRRGKWKRRRFSKTLVMFGNAIIHSAQLDDKCDPVFAVNTFLDKTRKRKSFSIRRRRWGLNQYIGACRNSFSAGGGVGNLVVTTTIE